MFLGKVATNNSISHLSSIYRVLETFEDASCGKPTAKVTERENGTRIRAGKSFINVALHDARAARSAR
jgi:hypothetical protein